jgi:hypothetical protein
MTINELKTTIDRFEGKYAVLHYGDGELNWPKESLPASAKEGDVIVLVAKRDDDARKDREDLAKAVINEILRKD